MILTPQRFLLIMIFIIVFLGGTLLYCIYTYVPSSCSPGVNVEVLSPDGGIIINERFSVQVTNKTDKTIILSRSGSVSDDFKGELEPERSTKVDCGRGSIINWSQK